MKLLVVLALCATAWSLQPKTDDRWQTFKSQHGKEYANGEEEVRYVYFTQNQAFVDEHNKLSKNYTLAMNRFGDMSDNEFVSFYLGYRQWPQEEPRAERRMFKASEVGDLPATVDWVPKGFVTPIKNQGACGSCWAFSTTGSLEGQHFKKTGKLVSLSEQNLVDCSKKEGDHGCGGGLMDFAFEYVQKNGGIDTEASYPYTAKTGKKCKFTEANIGATCTGHVDIKKGSEADLQQAVATIGPISVAIDASSKEFRFYKKGVLNDHKCSSKKLDHGVLAVGYGTEGSDDYWLVKNSWGKSWGAEGYIMMSRNKENQCGIATAASYPLV